MALVDYLPGIMRSGENITNTLAAIKQMDLQREAMTFDYAINKAKIDAENRRFGIEAGYREREMQMAEQQMGMAAESHKEQMETSDITQAVARKELSYMDELQDLRKKVLNSQLSSEELDRELKRFQRDLVKKQLLSQEAMNEFSSNIMKRFNEFREKSNKVAEVQIKKGLKNIEYEKRGRAAAISVGLKSVPGTAGDILSGMYNKWVAPTQKDIERATVDELLKDEERQKLLFYNEQQSFYNNVMSDLDEVESKYSKEIGAFDKMSIMNSLTQMFPMLQAPLLSYTGGNIPYNVPGITSGITKEENIGQLYNFLDLE